MAALVNLDFALLHLNQRNVDPDRLIDIQDKLDLAEAIVLDWCNTTAYWRAITVTWTEETVPRLVKAAILAQLAALFRFHGDDPKDDVPLTEWKMSPIVEGLLQHYRDPVTG
jgi:hypothetical protein